MTNINCRFVWHLSYCFLWFLNFLLLDLLISIIILKFVLVGISLGWFRCNNVINMLVYLVFRAMQNMPLMLEWRRLQKRLVISSQECNNLFSIGSTRRLARLFHELLFVGLHNQWKSIPFKLFFYKLFSVDNIFLKEAK